MTTFIISNPSKQNAIFFHDGRPIHVPMADSISLEMPDDGSLRTVLDRQGTKLGLTYTVKDETPGAAHVEGN